MVDRPHPNRPRNAWEKQAFSYMARLKMGYDRALNLVARDWLFNGETEPLQQLLIENRPIEDLTAKMLACLLDPDHFELPPRLWKYRLEVRRRDGKPGRKPSSATRIDNETIGEYVEFLMAKGFTKEAALTDADERLVGVSRSRIEKAYKALRRKRQAELGIE